MLTIGRLAAYVGATVRAVRHYHQRGLLAEPERDSSGYRTYDAQAVVDLIRIKTLADAGVPLARVGELLTASPERFVEAIAEIDEALRARIRELEEQRHRIAELAAGDRLFLPDDVAAFLDGLRAIGVSERGVQVERDTWILVAARYPEQAAAWARDKAALLGHPEFRRLYRAFDEAYDWDPADPRLERLADDVIAFDRRMARETGEPDEAAWTVDDPLTRALASGPPGSLSPAWERLTVLTQERAARG
jgi:DNA-binding transcriptional MerR regulator